MLDILMKKDVLYSPSKKIGEYSIVRKLGEGRYGISYLAKKDNSNVVIKQLKKKMMKKNTKKEFYEPEILQKIKNQNSNIPKFICNYKTDNSRGYILEFKEGKTLDELLLDGHIFDRNEIYYICEELLNIVECLHKNNIVHKDIRVPNIVYNQGEISLIDFGLARYIDNKKYTADLDFWYIGDCLLYLYYSSYEKSGKSKPWYKELDLYEEEKKFLKRLLNIDKKYLNIADVKKDFFALKRNYENHTIK